MERRGPREEEGNTGNKKALPGTRMGSAGRTGRRNKRFGDKKWGSWSDARREARKRKWASREPKARPGGPIRVKRRRATLPHPLECSTIAAPGLSYRVRNGTGRLTRAMTTAKPRSRNDSQNTWRPFRPLCYEPWRFGNRLADARQSLPLYRSVTIPTHIAVQDDPAQERRGTNPPQEDRNCCVAVAR